MNHKVRNSIAVSFVAITVVTMLLSPAMADIGFGTATAGTVADGAPLLGAGEGVETCLLIACLSCGWICIVTPPLCPACLAGCIVLPI